MGNKNLLKKYQQLEADMRERTEENRDIVVSYSEVVKILRLLEVDNYNMIQTNIEHGRTMEHKKNKSMNKFHKVDSSTTTKTIHLVTTPLESTIVHLDSVIEPKLIERYAIYYEGEGKPLEIDTLLKKNEDYFLEGTYKLLTTESISNLKADDFIGVIIIGDIKEVYLAQMIRQGLRINVYKKGLSNKQCEEYREKVRKLGCELIITNM